MKTINIRFLKQGLLTLDVPVDSTIEQMEQLGKQFMDKQSDHTLAMAMSDYIPCNDNPSRFDADSFQVEAIEDPTDDYEYTYQTNLWKAYCGH